MNISVELNSIIGKNATRSLQCTQAGHSSTEESQRKGISQDNTVPIDGRRNNPGLLNTSPIQEASKLEITKGKENSLNYYYYKLNLFLHSLLQALLQRQYAKLERPLDLTWFGFSSLPQKIGFVSLCLRYLKLEVTQYVLRGRG